MKRRIEEYKSPEDKAEEILQHEQLPYEYSHLNSLDIVEIFELMKEPSRAVATCISKGQLQTLCRKLLLDNLTLQKKIQKFESTVSQLISSIDEDTKNLSPQEIDELVKSSIVALLKKS